MKLFIIYYVSEARTIWICSMDKILGFQNILEILPLSNFCHRHELGCLRSDLLARNFFQTCYLVWHQVTTGPHFHPAVLDSTVIVCTRWWSSILIQAVVLCHSYSHLVQLNSVAADLHPVSIGRIEDMQILFVFLILLLKPIVQAFGTTVRITVFLFLLERLVVVVAAGDVGNNIFSIYVTQ